MCSAASSPGLVLLALSAGIQDPSLAVHSGVALAGYSAGVLLAAPIGANRADDEGTWPPSVTTTLVAEFCVLAVFSAGWDLKEEAIAYDPALAADPGRGIAEYTAESATAGRLTEFAVAGDDVRRIHGNDERIPVKSFQAGVRLMYQVVYDFSRR